MKYIDGNPHLPQTSDESLADLHTPLRRPGSTVPELIDHVDDSGLLSPQGSPERLVEASTGSDAEFTEALVELCRGMGLVVAKPTALSFEECEDLEPEDLELKVDHTTQQPTRKRSYKRISKQVTMGNHQMLVVKNHLQKLKNEADEGRRLKKAVSYKKYNWGDKASYCLGCGFAEVPQGSQYAVKQILPCIVKALFVEAEVEVPDDLIAYSMPSDKTIEELVLNSAAVYSYKTQFAIEKADTVCMASDKGKRSGIDHMPKFASMYNHDESRVESHLVDINGAGATSEDAAEAIEGSLVRTVDGDPPKLGVNTSDGGSGGTGQSAVVNLKKKDMTPLSRKRIPIKSLKAAIHREALKAELEKRNIDVGEDSNFNTWKSLLKKWLEEKKEDAKSFEPLTEHFDDFYADEAVQN